MGILQIATAKFAVTGDDSDADYFVWLQQSRLCSIKVRMKHHVASYRDCYQHHKKRGGGKSDELRRCRFSCSSE